MRRASRFSLVSGLLSLTLACVASMSISGIARAQSTQPAATKPAITSKPALATATDLERKTIEHLLHDSTWPRRAIAAMRLERYGCNESRDMLVKLLADPAWQARAFAIRTLGRRRISAEEPWFRADQDPRVIRDLLRYGYSIAPERLDRGVRFLARSSDLENKMLAAEIGAASGQEELVALARETAKQVILKMNRTDAGGLSSRLSVLTGQQGMYRPMDWQSWLMKVGRRFDVRAALAINPADAETKPLDLSHIAKLDPEPLAGLDTYMTKLSEREVDLVICIDCTASMGGALSAAQGGIDDLMRFVGDVVSSFRVAVVAYRDRSDEFETKSLDFTGDIAEARACLWRLTADGGGDTPEAVYPALKLAYTQLTWRPESTRVLVLVGDAPPHVGYGAPSIQLVQRGKDEGRVTAHVIQARNKDVKHFAEIAKAGGGRCVSLKDDDLLVSEIAGLTLADRFEDEFREFFQVYLELCR